MIHPVWFPWNSVTNFILPQIQRDFNSSNLYFPSVIRIKLSLLKTSFPKRRREEAANVYNYSSFPKNKDTVICLRSRPFGIGEQNRKFCLIFKKSLITVSLFFGKELYSACVYSTYGIFYVSMGAYKAGLEQKSVRRNITKSRQPFSSSGLIFSFESTDNRLLFLCSSAGIWSQVETEVLILRRTRAANMNKITNFANFQAGEHL